MDLHVVSQEEPGWIQAFVSFTSSIALASANDDARLARSEIAETPKRSREKLAVSLRYARDQVVE
jgi:hypothetical protein